MGLGYEFGLQRVRDLAIKIKTTTAYELITLGIIKIPPVRPKFTLKVPLNMNIAKQDLLHKKVYEVRSEKDDFMLNY